MHIEKGEPVREMMAAFTSLFWLQRTNSTYDSVDFGDPMSIVVYFKKICQAASGQSEEVVDDAITHLLGRIIDKESKDSSIKFPGVKALSIMKSTAEKIHGAFQELDRGEDSTAKTKLATITKTWMVVSRAMDECFRRLRSLDPDFNPNPK